MKPADNIKKLIKTTKIKTNPAVNKAVLDDLLNQMHQAKGPHINTRQQNTWRLIMKSKITKFSSAAAIVFCVFGILVFFGNGKTVYAQVKDAFEKAHSIHVVMTEVREGHWFKDNEIWYDCEQGVREEERYEKQTNIRIDNNQHEWRYTIGDKLVAQIASYRSQDEWTKDLYEWLRFDHERMTSGDKVIDGIPCKMYTLSTGSEKVSVWVNEQHRILEFEQEEQRNGQLIKSTATIEYDIEIDENLFLPEFDTDVEIVGPRELIEEVFPLETAIFKRESLGFVFAVHELKFGNGFKYLVCSNRLTEQVRDEISIGHPWTYYGGFDLRGIYDESGMYLDTSDEPILLAKMQHDGIQVDWYILIPSGSKAKQAYSCDVDVHINIANQLKEKLKAEGLLTQEKFRLNITLVETEEQLSSLSEICEEVYLFGEEFVPIVHSFLLTKVVTESDGNRVQAWKKPGTELSQEEYIKDCKDRVDYYLNQN